MKNKGICLLVMLSVTLGSLYSQCLIKTDSYRLICADEVRYADSISSGTRLYISSRNAYVTSPRSVFNLAEGYGQYFIKVTNNANNQKVAIGRQWINRIDSTSGNKALIYIKDINVTFTTTESYSAVVDSAISCFQRAVSSGLATLSDGDYGDVVVSGSGLVMTVDKPDQGLHNLADGDFSVIADSTALSLTNTRRIELVTKNIDGWISRYLQNNTSLTLRAASTTKTSRIYVDTTGANFQFVNGANNASLRIGDSVAVRFNSSGSVGQVLTVTSVDGDGRLVINPKTGGSGTANCEQTLTKNSHGFSKWTPIYWNGSAWARPTFDSIIPTYIVIDSTSANTFKVANCGSYSSTLTAGIYYYTGTSPGYTLTQPSIKTPLFEVAQSRLILQPLIGFQLANGSGGSGENIGNSDLTISEDRTLSGSGSPKLTFANSIREFEIVPPVKHGRSGFYSANVDTVGANYWGNSYYNEIGYNGYRFRDSVPLTSEGNQYTMAGKYGTTFYSDNATVSGNAASPYFQSSRVTMQKKGNRNTYASQSQYSWTRTPTYYLSLADFSVGGKGYYGKGDTTFYAGVELDTRSDTTVAPVLDDYNRIYSSLHAASVTPSGTLSYIGGVAVGYAGYSDIGYPAGETPHGVLIGKYVKPGGNKWSALFMPLALSKEDEYVRSNYVILGENMKVWKDSAKMFINKYHLPNATPANTLNRKSLMTWTGTGTRATAAFDTLGYGITKEAGQIKADTTKLLDYRGGYSYLYGGAAGAGFVKDNSSWGFYKKWGSSGYNHYYSYRDGSYPLYMEIKESMPSGVGTLIETNLIDRGGTNKNARLGLYAFGMSENNWTRLGVDSFSVIVDQRYLPLSASVSSYRLPKITKVYTSGIRLSAEWTGSGGISLNSPTFVEQNRGSVSGTTDGSGDLTVTFSAAMPDATYTFLCTAEGTTYYTTTVHTKATGTVKVRFFDATGAAVTATSVTISYEAKDY